MDIKEIKSKLKNLLQSNLDLLTKEISLIISEESIHYDDFIILNGRLKQLERDDLRNVISNDDKEKSFNNIRLGLLKIIKSINSEDLNNDCNQLLGFENKSIIQKLNNEYENLEKRYQNIKNWIEGNFKEFEYDFKQKEIAIIDADSAAEFQDVRTTDLEAKIFGAYVKIKFTIEFVNKWRYFNKQDNFASKQITSFIVVFNVLDLEKIELTARVIDGYYSSLYEVDLICSDGLNKINVNSSVQFDRIQHDENIDNWVEFEEEGEIDNYFVSSFSLSSTNKKFLDVFCIKILEFKNIVKELA